MGRKSKGDVTKRVDIKFTVRFEENWFAGIDDEGRVHDMLPVTWRPVGPSLLHKMLIRYHFLEFG